jgi:uncharacterized protein (UPF0210 family)
MRVRAITIGQKIPFLNEDSFLETFLREKLERAQQFNEEFIEQLRERNIEVQTKRLASQPILSYEHQLFEKNLNDTIVRIHQQLELIEKSITRYNMDYFACATVLAAQNIEKYGIYEKLLLNEVPKFIKRREKFFTSLPVATSENGINLSALRSGAKIIKELSEPDPFNNLKFCISTNVEQDTPFFPAAYHLSEKMSFALALETADEVVKIFSESESLTDAHLRLEHRFDEIYNSLSSISSSLGEKYDIEFNGIDFSPAPYPKLDRSIGTAFEKMGFEYFGAYGGLILIGIIKSAMPKRDKVIGFSGFMPSVLEDSTIARRCAENKFNLDTLLLYATICGTGLDCVPLPGDITEKELFYILLDLCTISIRLNKPLTARLMPIPGRNAFDGVEFDFEYFAPSKVMDVRRLTKDTKNNLFESKEKYFRF